MGITGGSKPIVSSRSTSSTVSRRTPCTSSGTPYDGWQYAPVNASPRNARHAHAPETTHATGYGSWSISTYALRTTTRASRKTRVASSPATPTGSWKVTVWHFPTSPTTARTPSAWMGTSTAPFNGTKQTTITWKQAPDASNGQAANAAHASYASNASRPSWSVMKY